MNIIIRQEEKKDYSEVYNLIKESFENAEHTDHNEQNLVEKLRKGSAFIPELSLVALYNNEIVGHILLTKIKIGDADSLALAPLAVLPRVQGMGIGGKLINEAHDVARNLGYNSVIVLGHESYYPKFGYKKASTWNVKAPFEVPDEAFMAIELEENALKDVNGTVEYAKEFLE